MTSLHTPTGDKKYITDAERDRFLAAARRAPRRTRALCVILAYTGCRLSEVLALHARDIDVEARAVTFRSLKKRRDDVFRSVPMPKDAIELLDLVFGLRERQGGARRNELLFTTRYAPRAGGPAEERPIARQTAWRAVKKVLAEAGISGAAATPRGFRHGVGFTAVGRGVALNIVKKWLGHAALSTTAIYADAVGEEERSIADRMWRRES